MKKESEYKKLYRLIRLSDACHIDHVTNTNVFRLRSQCSCIPAKARAVPAVGNSRNGISQAKGTKSGNMKVSVFSRRPFLLGLELLRIQFRSPLCSR